MNILALFQEMRHLYKIARAEGLNVRFYQFPSRVFSSQLVKKVHAEDGVLKVHLNFWGLYGGLGGLPDYFTDEIIRDKDETGGLKDFLDIFNHRLVEGMYSIWRKYQILLENGVEADKERNREFDLFLRSLAGILNESEDRPVHLRCLRRHHFALFQKREKTMLGLNCLLNSFFPDLKITLREHSTRFVRIPEDQRSELGASGLMIGLQGNFLVGAKVRDINGMFNMVIGELDYESYLRLLPEGDWFDLLSGLVKEYGQGQWDCDLTLELKAEEVPNFQLGQGRLSTNLWVKSMAPEENAIINVGRLAS